MGFTRTAYAGPETGVRDRASYVLEQGDVRFVVTSALREEHEITQAPRAARRRRPRHRAHRSRRDAGVPRGRLARRAQRHGAAARSRTSSATVELSAIATYGDTIHTFVDRTDYAGPFLPGYVSISENGHADPGVGLLNIDHVVGNVELGRMNYWVEFYERVFGMTNIIHFGDDQISDRVLGADVEGHVGRQREDQVPDQRAGRGQAQEPDRGVRRVLRRRRRAAHRARVERHRRHRRGDEGARLPRSSTRPTRTTTRPRVASARSPRSGRSCRSTRSSSTATTTATCSRSSRRRRRTGRRCSSR